MGIIDQTAKLKEQREIERCRKALAHFNNEHIGFVPRSDSRRYSIYFTGYILPDVNVTLQTKVIGMLVIRSLQDRREDRVALIGYQSQATWAVTDRAGLSGAMASVHTTLGQAGEEDTPTLKQQLETGIRYAESAIAQWQQEEDQKDMAANVLRALDEILAPTESADDETTEEEQVEEELVPVPQEEASTPSEVPVEASVPDSPRKRQARSSNRP